MPRKKKSEHQIMMERLHRELAHILNDCVHSHLDNKAYVSLWYNGDLKKLKTSCVKILNIVDSIYGMNFANAKGGPKDVR